MLWYQLLRPLAYLRIKDESKWTIDWAVPGILAALSAIIFAVLPLRPSVFGAGGIVALLSPILAIMPGFYLAALAAIATFNKNDMDEYLPAPTPKVDTMVHGKSLIIELTRRRLLCLQFGYLTFISLALYILCVTCAFLAPSLGLALEGTSRLVAAVALVLLIAFLFWHMIIITLFGLYQLADRMHQPDPRSVSADRDG